MIIVRLKGGLGNQLFQYSLGRALAESHKTELKLDTSWYGAIPDRQYDLDHFAISAQLADPSEIKAVRDNVIAKLTNTVKSYHHRSVILERSFRFDPEVLQAGPNVYLDGYWQSPRYFNTIADTIRRELTVKAAPKGKNKALLAQIEGNDQAVSLHVRRGDYVSSKSTNQYHGICSLDYYQAAMTQLIKKIKKPHFYIFSDDPDWTKANLKLKHPTTFVTHNTKAAHEDLRLMSHCRHFIIANSTFSWWGAWLSLHPNKLVFYPKPWFKDPSVNSQDLCPKEWRAVTV